MVIYIFIFYHYLSNLGRVKFNIYRYSVQEETETGVHLTLWYSCYFHVDRSLGSKYVGVENMLRIFFITSMNKRKEIMLCCRTQPSFLDILTNVSYFSFRMREQNGFKMTLLVRFTQSDSWEINCWPMIGLYGSGKTSICPQAQYNIKPLWYFKVWQKGAWFLSIVY